MEAFDEMQHLVDDALRTNDANHLHFIHLCLHMRDTANLLDTLKSLNRPILRRLIRDLERKLEFLIEKLCELED